MPASLRKACHACTKAKRRCESRLPACDRCQRQGIKCIYDLEPVHDLSILNAPVPRDSERAGVPPAYTPVVYGSLRDARDAAVAAFEQGASTFDPETHPLMMADDLIEWMVCFFKKASEACTSGKPSPYVHFNVVETARRRITDLNGTAGNTSKSREQNAENKVSDTEQDMIDVYRDLLRIYELIRALIDRILARDLRQSLDEVGDSIDTLMSMTQALWSRDDIAAYTNETWQDWTVSESIRRSYFASYQIRCTWEALTQGYATFTPFLEALPLDFGAGLWEATSAEEFAAVKQKCLAGCTTLLSLEEFTKMNLGRLRPEFDGQFQRSLFVGFNGVAGITFLTQLDHNGL